MGVTAKACRVLFLICVLILEREGGGERKKKGGRERERNIDGREKHQLATSHMRPNQGSNLHPRQVPSLRIESPPFWCIGWHSNQLSHAGQGCRVSF